MIIVSSARANVSRFTCRRYHEKPEYSSEELQTTDLRCIGVFAKGGALVPYVTNGSQGADGWLLFEKLS